MRGERPDIDAALESPDADRAKGQDAGAATPRTQRVPDEAGSGSAGTVGLDEPADPGGVVGAGPDASTAAAKDAGLDRAPDAGIGTDASAVALDAAVLGDAGPSSDAGVDAGCRDTMLPGERLYAGDSRCSANGLYRLTMTSDGDLRLLFGDTAIWSAGTCCGDHNAPMQRDGNLVVYDAAGRALFSSRTPYYAGAWLRVEDDGRAVIWLDGQIIWSTSN